MRAGVTVVDPLTTWVDVTATVAADAVLQPGTQLLGTTTVEPGAVVGPDTTLVDMRGRGGRVRRPVALPGRGDRPRRRRSARSATCGRAPGWPAGAKVGAFVETKNVEVGEGSKVPHLSYVGDATIGRGVEHRGRDRLRQLRRRGQAPHDRRRPRPHRLGHHARGAGHGGGRRLHRGRLGDHLRRPARGAWPSRGRPSGMWQAGCAAAAPGRPRPTAAEAAESRAEAAGTDTEASGTERAE